MVYDGFLRVGGVEVVNTERARGYAITAGCPSWMVRGTPCDTLSDALGETVYQYASIDQAPWYDQSLADLSSRFFGVVGVGIVGVTDSTRSVSVTEGIADGGVVGRTRKGVRSVRVRGVLIAQGADALDYGSEWLEAVFDGTCSQHGDACGTMDMEFFAACPPARGEVPDVAIRQNILIHPLVAASTDWWSLPAITTASVDATVTRRAGVPSLKQVKGAGAVSTAGYAANLGRTGDYAIAANRTAVTVGDVITASVYVRTTTAGTQATIAISGYSSANVVVAATSPAWSPLATGVWERREITWTVPAGVATVHVSSAITMVTGNAPTGAETWMMDPQLEIASAATSYFDGNMADLDGDRFSWTGAANSSTSEAERDIIRPRTDEEYALIVNPYRRFMHDVSVTSGPLDVEMHRPVDGFVSKVVEFTITSERAWVYGMTKALTLSPTLPTVAQDIPYNLIPYPSAELSSGTVVAATNLSTNPGVEVNATDWLAASAAVSGTAPTAFVTSGRSTDIGAGGSTASFRTRLLGDNGTTAVAAAVATIDGYQDVTIPAGTGRRISLNLWAACLILGGASPGTLINSLAVSYEFFNGAASLGAATNFGTAAPADYSGKSYSLASLVVPATATKVRMRARANVTWTSTATAGQNSDIRLYVDALTVSVP